ncbi:hypothetical protein LNI98_09500 [Tenacibaculum dicentrarchi]|nr:hypothetical protein [Tenacibaculum dicentrarchi]MCD8415536.1 hypothetical protein [Tenacibaculum dicentrarchi]MCD8420660.1 hypothetical protein [Tenacibaculum dicentrarchi]MCD8443072.1 hypothetical protein [Tenacibaculum dicentrarchi]MCD8449929.1 hypothetical protein [Tenacibaculum dicentrarchi]
MKKVNNKTQKNAYLIVGVLILLVLWIKNHFFDFVNKQSSEFFNVGETTISDNQANQYADILHTAMGSLGTDFDLILSVFASLGGSKNNYYKVYNKFGDRGYIDVIGVGVDIGYPKMLNLTQWLVSELSESEIRKLSVIAPYLSF